MDSPIKGALSNFFESYTQQVVEAMDNNGATELKSKLKFKLGSDAQTFHAFMITIEHLVLCSFVQELSVSSCADRVKDVLEDIDKYHGVLTPYQPTETIH